MYEHAACHDADRCAGDRIVHVDRVDAARGGLVVDLRSVRSSGNPLL
jgi:hypothetical protein